MIYRDEPLPENQHPVFIEECTRALESLRTQCRSFRSAAFATDDGFEISRLPATDEQDQRLASMASSLQALTEAVAKDRALGSTQYSLVEAEVGRVLLRRVPGHKVMLLAVFGDEEVAGQAVSISRSVLEDLSFQLPRQAASFAR